MIFELLQISPTRRFLHIDEEPLMGIECLKCGNRQPGQWGDRVRHQCGKPKRGISAETISVHWFMSPNVRDAWLSEPASTATPTHWPPTP